MDLALILLHARRQMALIRQLVYWMLRGKFFLDKDAAKSGGVMEAMLKMTKININDLQNAYDCK